MKKVALTVLGVLALAASANAQGTWYTSYATWQSLLPKRLMGLATSTLLITFIAAAAHADDVLTLGTVVVPKTIAVVISTYTFNSSMILNSIGFVSTSGTNFAVYRYSINGETYIDVDRLSVDLASAVNDVRWFSLATPITLNANDVVRVSTARTVISGTPKVRMLGYTAVPGFDITVVGNDQSYGALTNSNLRVSALPLGSSVAPEPGTLPLALTGGCALVGMCIRRRRMSN